MPVYANGVEQSDLKAFRIQKMFEQWTLKTKATWVGRVPAAGKISLPQGKISLLAVVAV